MSQADSQDPEKGKPITIVTTDGHHNQSSSSPIRPLQGETKFGDSSGPLFTMYSKVASEEDKKMAERWQKDAEGTIIFTGLFSAVVTALAVVSIQDLRPNPQDNSAFYLEKIYQLQLDPSISRTLTPSAPAFSPPKYAIWVNVLWFMSLVISLTCAMLATLLQQWARRYIRITQLPRRTPDKRARVRAFFANGVDKFQVAWAVEALPTLVHLSLFIFFAGLLVFLFNINHTVFGAVVGWAALSLVVYAWITLMPIFLHDSPYYAPLSSAVWLLYATMLYGVLTVLKLITFRFHPHHNLMTWSHLCYLTEIDGRIVEWTVDALSEDDELERFLEAIPGFYNSEIVEHLQQLPPGGELQQKIEVTAGKFLNRTLSSGSVSESVIRRRLDTCLNVVGGSLGVAGILRTMVDGHWHGVPRAVETGHFLMRWVKGRDENVIVAVRCMIARIVASARERDDRWMALTVDHLGVSERILQDYLARGNSVLLANLIHVTRQLSLSYWVWTPMGTLLSLSTFDVRNTMPALRDDFCLLWNQIVREAQHCGEYSSPVAVLAAIRHLYIDFHRGTDAAPTAFSDSTNDFDDILFKPPTYPLCNVPDHILSVSMMGETTPALATTPLSHTTTLFRPLSLPLDMMYPLCLDPSYQSTPSR